MSAVVSTLGFTRSSSEILENIYIPRYYDPQIEGRLAELEETHDLVTLGALIDTRDVSVHRGHDIGKHHYGGGTIPYVRTSDLATWEVVAAPKQTVSRSTYDEYQAKQDVREGDILFVCDGLYLIGRTALITSGDLPLIHQSHLIRLRVSSTSSIDKYLLLALLNTPVVRWQVRSKQFTAGIIDKIEGRYRELVLPVPRDSAERSRVTTRVEHIVSRRSELRERLERLPRTAQGIVESRGEHEVTAAALVRSVNDALLGYTKQSDELVSNIMLPKYYSPGIAAALDELAACYVLRTIQDLVDDGVLSIATGLEVGKLAYGTGDVPFIRTSDLANWELAGQPKQLVSEPLYTALKARADLRTDDILLVRDGTYLVGTSAILTPIDAKALYAGGLYRIRVLQKAKLDPYVLLCMLNSPIVKLQMRSKQFTRDIIDTLGRRLFEVQIPVPKDPRLLSTIAAEGRAIVEERARLRDEAKQLVLGVEAFDVNSGEELAVVAALAL